MMNRKRNLSVAISLVVMALVVTAASAEDKGGSNPVREPDPKQNIEVRVVFSELNGDTVASKLPYMLLLTANNDPRVLRSGIQVPVPGVSTDGRATVQYRDVGTNIDCQVRPSEDGRFFLHLQVERTRIAAFPPPKGAAEKTAEKTAEVAAPSTFNMRQSMTFVLRDGQTVTAGTVTDDVTGRVTKVDVTLQVLK